MGWLTTRHSNTYDNHNCFQKQNMEKFLWKKFIAMDLCKVPKKTLQFESEKSPTSKACWPSHHGDWPVTHTPTYTYFACLISYTKWKWKQLELHSAYLQSASFWWLISFAWFHWAEFFLLNLIVNLDSDCHRSSFKSVKPITKSSIMIHSFWVKSLPLFIL